jgi:hypothetical protein
MRLYFHLIDSQDFLLDGEGVDVIDVSQAQTLVRAMLQELQQEEASTAQDWSGWALNVTDSAGRVLFSIDLDGVGR